ncbi:calcium/sodium antiporter [Endozoicomonas sp. Mp262]|uniref:calcium/sodium antiporter n=1 Tax=Endozoicomonas sp. Mp262 TaxID=2919499 RepID=UPI0021D907F3
MYQLIQFLAAIAIGFLTLSWSADRLIEVASTLAFRLGMSVLTIGMTIVAFGTSAPELLVSSVAAYNGAGGISVGNALGSNTINIGLVLGAVGLMVPLVVSPRILYRELPVLGLVMALCVVLLLDGHLGRIDGFVLGGTLLAYCYYLTRSARGEEGDAGDVVILKISTPRAWIEALLMLALLMGSSQILVWGATGMARYMGVSELVIGLTVIAFGTSLPELAAALASARKGLFDMTLATVIGSNIFNLLGVLAFPGIIGNGIALDPEILHRDVLAMVGLTLLLAVIAYTSIVRQPPKMATAETGALSAPAENGYCLIPRYKSLLLLIGFVLYLGWLFMTA